MSGTGGASWLRKQTTAAALLVFATGCLMAITPGAQAQTSSAPATQSDSSTLPSAPQPANSSDNSSTSIGGSTGGGSPIQLSTQSSLFNAYLGSVQAQPVVPREIPLTLDDALSLGLRNNLGAIYSLQTEQLTSAQRQQVLNVLLPNMDLQGGTAFHQFNLQSFGFTSSAIQGFGSLIPPGQTIDTIVKVDVTQGQANLSQYLFNWSGFDLYRSYGHLARSSHEDVAVALGQTIVSVGNAYFQAVAAAAQIQYDQALLATDNHVLYQTAQKHQAGVLANLDELRARVQFQTQEQDLIRDQNTLAKAKVALNRTIGLAPEQQISIRDDKPVPELNENLSLEQAVAEALQNRHAYRSAREKVLAYEEARRAAVHERYPSLIFNGDYGVQGVSGGIYHGVFSAVATLKIPIFEEAKFRSDRDSASFQLDNARAQFANLHQQIAQQVQDGLIDLHTANEVVRVAKSNLDLSEVALDQAQQRFQAGLEDNLPTIEAISTAAQAQTQAVHAAYQYNVARLAFAQYLGLLDTPRQGNQARPAGVKSNQAAQENLP